MARSRFGMSIDRPGIEGRGQGAAEGQGESESGGRVRVPARRAGMKVWPAQLAVKA